MSEPAANDYAVLALDAGDGLTPLCLACLAPVDLGHHLESLGRGLYVDVATPEGARRSVLCGGCSAGTEAARERLAALGAGELARRLVGPMRTEGEN